MPLRIFYQRVISIFIPYHFLKISNLHRKLSKFFAFFTKFTVYIRKGILYNKSVRSYRIPVRFPV